MRPSGRIDRDGWRLKLYDITLPGETIDEGVFEAGLPMALRALPAPAFATSRPGVGFLIRHQGLDRQGRRIGYLVLCWWDNGNELMTEVFICGAGTDGKWIDARGRGSFCVWDMQIMAHERDAYVRAMLSGGGAEVESYLADTLAVSV